MPSLSNLPLLRRSFGSFRYGMEFLYRSGQQHRKAATRPTGSSPAPHKITAQPPQLPITEPGGEITVVRSRVIVCVPRGCCRHSAAVSLSPARLSHLRFQVKLQQVQVQEMFPPPPENSSRGNDEILIVPEDDLSTDCKKKVLSCFWCFTQESVELCSQCGLVASCDKHWKQHR